MTGLEEIELHRTTTVEEVLALIDKGLGGLSDRNLVPASEVTDLLLDVRSLLSDRDSGDLPPDVSVMEKAE